MRSPFEGKVLSIIKRAKYLEYDCQNQLKSIILLPMNENDYLAILTRT